MNHKYNNIGPMQIAITCYFLYGCSKK